MEYEPCCCRNKGQGLAESPLQQLVVLPSALSAQEAVPLSVHLRLPASSLARRTQPTIHNFAANSRAVGAGERGTRTCLPL